MDARAYVYAGDWVAECPRPDCANVEFLHALRYPDQPPSPANRRDVRKPVFACTNCLHIGPVEWPPEDFKAAVDQVLAQRPVPQTRNWYPEGHRIAVAFRLPHGQSIDDLRSESAEHGVGV